MAKGSGLKPIVNSTGANKAAEELDTQHKRKLAEYQEELNQRKDQIQRTGDDIDDRGEEVRMIFRDTPGVTQVETPGGGGGPAPSQNAGSDDDAAGDTRRAGGKAGG